MTTEIFISRTLSESRMAVVCAGELTDILIEREQTPSLVGNIYLGVVVRVLAGMQAAFVDIGRSRMAFLHLDDLDKSKPLINQSAPSTPMIWQYLQAGQRIIVQVIKDEFGDKGARLTTKISLATGRMVYFVYETHFGVSKKIQKEKQAHLQSLLKTFRQFILQGGLIARTLAQDATDQELQTDAKYLYELWQTIVAKSHLKKPQLLYQTPSAFWHYLQNCHLQAICRIWIDDLPLYQQILALAQKLNPAIVPLLQHYQDDVALFEKHQIETQLHTALLRKVPLKSGGYLVIDHTEAMTVIDVNTGSFVGRQSFSQTIYQTNLEAASSIAHQIRLRNLGGIILVDFIDMSVDKHKKHLFSYFNEKLSFDSAVANVAQVSKLGLIEITRKRTQQSLSQQLFQTCPCCQGQGMIKTAQTISFEICRKLMSAINHTPNVKAWQVIAHSDVIEYLLSSQMTNDLQTLTGKSISFKNVVCLIEQYQIGQG